MLSHPVEMVVHHLNYNVRWDREGALKFTVQFCLKCFTKPKLNPKKLKETTTKNQQKTPKKLKPKPKPKIICIVLCSLQY